MSTHGAFGLFFFRSRMNRASHCKQRLWTCMVSARGKDEK